MTYTPRVPREHNNNHTALNLSFRAAQSAHTADGCCATICSATMQVVWLL